MLLMTLSLGTLRGAGARAGAHGGNYPWFGDGGGGGSGRGGDENAHSTDVAPLTRVFTSV